MRERVMPSMKDMVFAADAMEFIDRRKRDTDFAVKRLTMTPEAYDEAVRHAFDRGYRLAMAKERVRFDRQPTLLVDDIIFNNPATIVKWMDGTKTVVRCQGDDVYDKEKGIALCFLKKLLGNSSRALNECLRLATDVEEVEK